MAAFNSSKFFPTALKDISEVVNDTRNYFLTKGYEVTVESTPSGSFISLSKGGIFKSVLGMKTSLNVDINCMPGGIAVDAKVGIFGQQAIPTLISMFVAWPVLLTQVGGLIQQSKLDDEVLSVIEQSIYRHQIGTAPTMSKEFCVSCGASMPAGAAFCPVCGAKQG